MKFSYRNKLVTVKIDILGKTFRFLIDTGSERSFLVPNNHLVNFQKDLKQKVNVKGIGPDKIIEYFYCIPQIEIDGQIIRETDFLMKDRSLMFYFLGIDGIIGWDILKRINFLINFKDKLFIVSEIKLENLHPSVPIVPDKQLVVQLSYHNRNIKALIDSGANTSVISKEILSSLEFIKLRRNIVFGINGIFISKIPELSNIEINFGNKNIIVSNVNIKTLSYSWLLKLGTDIFRNYKVYINNLESEVVIVE